MLVLLALSSSLLAQTPSPYPENPSHGPGKLTAYPQPTLPFVKAFPWCGSFVSHDFLLVTDGSVDRVTYVDTRKKDGISGVQRWTLLAAWEYRGNRPSVSVTSNQPHQIVNLSFGTHVEFPRGKEQVTLRSDVIPVPALIPSPLEGEIFLQAEVTYYLERKSGKVTQSVPQLILLCPGEVPDEIR